MSKSLVLIGASSFIATNFIKNYKKYHIKAITRKIEKNHTNSDNLTWYECNIENQEGLLKIFNNGDIIINCAYSNDGISKNLNLIKNIIDCANKKNVKKLIHFSTAVVAGSQKRKVIYEDVVCNPVTKYQKDKLEIESYLLKSSLNFNLVILRPTAVFGIGGKNLIKNIEASKKNRLIIDILKVLILGNRHMHLVSVENVTKTIDFFIKEDADIKSEIFFVSQDSDTFNYYKNVYPKIFYFINKFDYSYLSNFALPRVFLIFLFKIFGKRYEEIATIFSSRNLNRRGVYFDNDLEESIQIYLEKQ
jgi:nucleoside-diphosphate-sugar epimerase